MNLRVVIADDERPARSYLTALLRGFDDVELVGEATNGAEAVTLIERQHPDLALLDLEMPELDGIAVVRLLKKERLPLVAFVTAFDEYAVRAFELHAVDYLLKPVNKSRLRETLNRAHERLERSEQLEAQATSVRNAAAAYEASARPLYLERLPVRRGDEILILPVREIVSVVAEGELLRVTNVNNEQYCFSYRLKELEARLDPARFVRLGRGILANVEKIVRVSPMPGGTYRVTLSNDKQLSVSRQQSRVLREQLLKI